VRGKAGRRISQEEQVTNPLKLVPVIAKQMRGRTQMERVREPASVTNDAEDVQAYDRVMKTALAVAYAAGLAVIHRARPEPQGAQKALDLASGPGHYTLSLQTHLNYASTTGLDFAPNMVAIAQKNAREKGLQDRARFELGDATHLKDIADHTFDLCSFTDAAHQMEDVSVPRMAKNCNEADLEIVRKVLGEMDRVTKPEGLVMVMDLARLRNAGLTDAYVENLASDYDALGLQHFKRQFRDSMYAAWTFDELETAIPKNSSRVWFHLVTRLLPTLQIIVGLPVGRQALFLRKGFPWRMGAGPTPWKRLPDWFFVWLTLFVLDKPKRIVPAQADGRVPAETASDTTRLRAPAAL
jgi:ubiquinone/menaquinone biosynthesis C-methylase UbiE